MADQPKTPPVATAQDTIKHLESLKIKYLEKSGYINHNPHLTVGKLVQPLIDAITKSGTVTDVQLAAIKALPAECPVVNPNYVEPVKPKVVAPQMPAGAK